MRALGELLTTPTTQLGRASRFLVFQIKLWSHCIRLLKRNRANHQAAALSYYTIFGLVPLAIVVLLIFQLFPASQDIGDRLKQFAYEQLNLTKIVYSQGIEDQQEQAEGQQETEEQQEAEAQTEKVMLTDYFDGIINKFFGTSGKQSLSLVSALIVIWAALALLSTIEQAFNHIWHVTRGRGFLHRMINYWALLTLGPLLLGAGIYVTTQYGAFKNIEGTAIGVATPLVLSYFPSLLGFFFLYFVLPNTKVKPAAALWGAAVAALAWHIAKYGFGAYVTEFIPYSKIYGVLGLIPLGVFWIHITWLIALFGLQLTYTTQHLKRLDAAEIAAARKAKEECFITNDLTAINMARQIAEAFVENRGPTSAASLCGDLNIPLELGEDILDLLVHKGLLLKTAEPRSGFIPARAPDQIKLSEIVESLAEIALAQPDLDPNQMLGKLVTAHRQFLGKHSLREIVQTTETASPGLSNVSNDVSSHGEPEDEPPSES